MDWDFAVRRQREALMGVLAALLAMAGLARVSSPLVGEDGSARRGEAEALAEPGEGCLAARPTLPRHLHRAVLRLLRPAEAAARRLVIMAARGVAVTLPPPRPRQPKPAPPVGRPGAVTGIRVPPHLSRQADRLLSARRRAPAFRALPLFDPLPRLRFAKRRASGVPRLCLPGWSAPHPVPLRAPPGPDDPIDAARLALRLAALGRALDDLPAHARRFARWQARWAAGAGAPTRDSSQAAGAPGPRRPSRARRLWPLKPGRPPGVSGRAGLRARPDDSLHDILRDTHALALQALERFDTS